MASIRWLVVAALAAGGRAGTPSSADCKERFFTQTLDHFNWNGNATFQQRYFVCDQFWRKTHSANPPIFWYFGNEDDVTLYVNHTGLMWENAAQYGALLVFSEHRYYGRSLPFSDGTPGCMQWLTTEQAMADTAILMPYIKQQFSAEKSPIIGFGGSYGGMIAAWFRIRYPWLCQGVVSASAPIFSFLGMDPPYDSNAFDQIVTADASAAGGATDNCKTNFRAALPIIYNLTESSAGRRLLSEAFMTCSPLQSAAEAEGLVYWVQGPWATMAMGNYPYPSSYLMHGHSLLPAWPVRTACQPLNRQITDQTALMEAVRMAVAVYYNNTGQATCFYNGNTQETPLLGRMSRRRGRQQAAAVDGSCAGTWDYQWCTEMVQPFSSGTPQDMFWPASPFDLQASIQSCQNSWGVTPRPYWAPTTLASKDLRGASNIVFSNGNLDPWHGGGVLNNVSETVVAVLIADGAHHLDLMFSNPLDPPDVLAARQLELQHIDRWINDYRQQFQLE